MPDLSVNVAGIKSPNPFWLASGPPTNTAYQIANAFARGGAGRCGRRCRMIPW